MANAYARAAALFSGVPSLVVVHSDPHFDYPNPLARFVYAVVEHLTRFPTKHYIVVSEYLKSKLVFSGIPESKITVVYIGVASKGSYPKQPDTFVADGRTLCASDILGPSFAKGYGGRSKNNKYG